MPFRLPISRLPLVRKALLGKPNPEVVHITTKDRVHERVVSGAWHTGEKSPLAGGKKGEPTKELVQEAPRH